MKRRPRTERPSCSIGLRNQGSTAPHGWRRGTENDGTEHAFAAPRTVQRNLRIGNLYLAHVNDPYAPYAPYAKQRAEREVQMKTLTLHQPWASLIADGRKTIETRSWPPPRALVGERIAIHAGKQVDMPLASEWYAGQSVPLGAILCTARIDDSARVVTGSPCWRAWWSRRRVYTRVPEDEFGDFSLGRYLWQLSAVEAVDPVVYVRGRQGLWDWAGS